MHTRLFSVLALLAIFVTAVPLSAASLQATSSAQRGEVALERPKIDPELLTRGLKSGPLAAKAGAIKVVIELNDAPTAAVYAAALGQGAVQATASAKQQLAQIDRTQQTLVRELQSSRINATVLYRTQRVYNGIAVKVDANKLSEIAQLADVKAIHRLVPKTLENASSVPLIGAPQVWASNGLDLPTGQGISIAVIDTGIDYLHTGFGGPGTEAAYAANDETTNSDGYFPTAKVVGGYDFVGDDYDAGSDENDVPQPDPDPIDCNGHGSHVAGSAAGYGVRADGSTYTGPYNTSTPFNTLRIGPGVAPRADLYALKVFGCDGSTDLTEAAIEWAVDPNGDGDFSDRVDVINMSLGSDYGSVYDASAIATDNAVAIGVIVVTSAGNSEDSYFNSGAPGSATRAIATASSVDELDVLDGFRVNSPPSIAGVKPASQSVAFNWEGKQPVTADLVYPPTQRTGCVAFSDANKALINGKIVLLDWTDGECGSVARGANAVAAGARGFILVDNSEVFDLFITGSAVIPGVSTTKQVGDQLKSALASGTVNVTLTPEYNNATPNRDPDIVDTLSAFSSRGPRRGDGALKPDIAAPGQSIFSVGALTGNQGATISGTSMASPHVAGSMALLRQIYPDWTVEQLKALAMNTANNDVRSAVASNSPIYGPQRVGAGRITLQDAIDSQVVAYNADQEGMVSVSFGIVEVVGSTTATRNIRVENKGTTSATYDVTYVGASNIPGVTFSVSPSTVTVAPNSTANVVVTMTATASQMQHTIDPTASKTQTNQPRHWLSEESGRVILTPDDGAELRVPVYAAARAASNMRGTPGALNFGTSATDSETITLRGQGVGSAAALGTANNEDEVSIVTAYELQASSPNEASSENIANNADLKYIGIASDAKTGGTFADATIAFGIAAQGDWSSPNEVEFDIYIDTNRDGTDDYVLFNWNLASAQGAVDANDVFITYLVNLNDDDADPSVQFLNGLPSSVINTVPFNTNVMMLPVAAADLGLTATNASFNYTVVSFSRDADGVVDVSPTLSYNAARPGLDVTADAAVLNAYTDLPGNEISVDYSLTDYKLAKSQGVLLLHHSNTRGQRDQVINVISQFPNRLFLPTIRNGATPTANLSGTQEVPPVQTQATGRATFAYNAQTRVLNYTLEVSNIQNVTGAHIHRGAAGVNGPVAYSLLPAGGTLAPGAPVSGQVTVSAADETLLLNGGMYVNVHTTQNPGGEIRGQIVTQ